MRQDEPANTGVTTRLPTLATFEPILRSVELTMFLSTEAYELLHELQILSAGQRYVTVTKRVLASASDREELARAKAKIEAEGLFVSGAANDGTTVRYCILPRYIVLIRLTATE